MANRTALIVMVGALAALGASFSIQSQPALAHETDEASLAAIATVEVAAIEAIERVDGRVADELAGATSNSQAKDIRNAGLDAIDTLVAASDADLYRISEDAHGSEPVVAAAGDARGSIAAQAISTAAAVNALYDDWYFVFNAPPAEEVIGKIEAKLADGLEDIDGIVGHLFHQFDHDHVKTVEDAAQTLAAGLEDLADEVVETQGKLDYEAAKRSFDPIVQAAHSSASGQLEAGANEAASVMKAIHDDWIDANTTSPTTTTSTVVTTTTVVPTTTTTLVKPTTTTTTSTTTTTLAPTNRTSTTTTTLAPTTTTTRPPATTTTTTSLPPPAPLPPTDPPVMSETLFMAATPTPIVEASTASTRGVFVSGADMAAVGFVTRVVDSELPVAVSIVAAGPLVVLGLILDAIRAAGTLLAVPWMVLIVYMLWLLREHRLTEESSGAVAA